MEGFFYDGLCYFHPETNMADLKLILNLFKDFSEPVVQTEYDEDILYNLNTSFKNKFNDKFDLYTKTNL